ncbi:MAG: TRAP transporter permease [Lautropia sp.]
MSSGVAAIASDPVSNRVLAGGVIALCAFLGVFHLYLALSASIQSLMVQNIHLGVSIALVGLVVAQRAAPGRRAWGLTLAALGLVVMFYIGVEFDRLIAAQGYPPAFDIGVGVLLIVLVFEATRLQWGIVLPLLALLALAYYVFGSALPGAWGAPPTPFSTVVSNLSIGLYSGTFGTFMAISANDVFLFMLFGGLLETMDGNRPFMELGKTISRRLPGGAGLTTVVSSGAMGTVTGAAVSNVAICGVYTIPWMKRDGYPPEVAAAIEATASTGGQLAPPVMGSVAFIMAALLAVPYWDIVVTAVIPSVFFYVAVFAAVFLKSRRLGIPRMPTGADMFQLLYFLPLFMVPLIVLTVLLAQLRSVAYAAFFAIVTLVAMRLAMVFVGRLLPPDRASSVYGGPRPTLAADLERFLRQLKEGTTNGVLQGAGIAVVMGTVGVLSECVTATGAAVPLGWAVEALAGQSMFIALLATAVMCLILGAGIPTVGAYVLTAAIAGPIVTELGVDLYLTHFFILYFACLSAITPPVAAAALAASAIANASYFRTAWEATLLSAMVYLLPFLFIYEPALLARDVPGLAAMTLLLAEVTVITVLVSAGSQGFLAAPLTAVGRSLCWLSALALSMHVCGVGRAWLAAGLVVLAVLLPGQVAAGLRAWRHHRASSA